MNKNFYTLGYIEAKKKPKLYFKEIDGAILFIDLRDSFSFDHRFYFKKLRELKEEEIPEITKKIINEYNYTNKAYLGRFDLDFWDLGYCNYCDKELLPEIAKNGAYCSKRCSDMAEKEEEKYKIKHNNEQMEKRESEKCLTCGKMAEIVDEEGYIFLQDYDRHKHHTDYNKNVTVHLCSSCHGKAHNPHKYTELKHLQPKGTRKEMLEKKKKERICVICKGPLEKRQRKYCFVCKEERAKKEAAEKSMRRIRPWIGNDINCGNWSKSG